MKKEIIIYIAYAWKEHAFNMFLINLGYGFKSLGYKVKFSYLDNWDSMLDAMEDMLEDKVLCSITMNASALDFTYEEIGNTRIYELVDTCHVSILQDAPYNRVIGDMSEVVKNHVVTYLDRSHAKMMEHIMPQKQFGATLFLPMAACANPYFNEKQILNQKQRKFDVVCIAGLRDTEPKRIWHQYVDKVTCAILDNIVDYMEKYPANLCNAIEKILADLQMDFGATFPLLKPYLCLLYEYVKSYRRIKAIKFLVDNDITVDVFGSGWEKLNFADKLRIHGPVSYSQSLTIISRSKILYQDQAEFNDGAHDRVFTGMLNGAVVVSEYSKYLAEIFEPNKEIFLYDWLHGVEQVSVIKDLLADDNKRTEIAKKAYKKVREQHCWVNRAQSVLEAVNSAYQNMEFRQEKR